MFAVKCATASGLCAAFGIAYMVQTATVNAPPAGSVGEGKTRICVSGYNLSPPTAHSHFLADKIARKHGDKYETWYFWSIFAYHKFLFEKFDKVSFGDLGAHKLVGHETSPFVWFETQNKESGSPQVSKILGGNDRFCEWVQQTFPDDEELVSFAKQAPSVGSMIHYKKAPATASEK